MLVHPQSWKAGISPVLASGALLALFACTPYYEEPVAVQQSNPTVTYNYTGDQELIAANQKASAHCTRYSAVAQTVNLSDNADGTKSVTFECVPTAQAVEPTFSPSSNMSYTVDSDQELLQASRVADTYCANQGQRAVASSISPSGASGIGTRTVTFQCVPG